MQPSEGYRKQQFVTTYANAHLLPDDELRPWISSNDNWNEEYKKAVDEFERTLFFASPFKSSHGAGPLDRKATQQLPGGQSKDYLVDSRTLNHRPVTAIANDTEVRGLLDKIRTEHREDAQCSAGYTPRRTSKPSGLPPVSTRNQFESPRLLSLSQSYPALGQTSKSNEQSKSTSKLRPATAHYSANNQIYEPSFSSHPERSHSANRGREQQKEANMGRIALKAQRALRSPSSSQNEHSPNSYPQKAKAKLQPKSAAWMPRFQKSDFSSSLHHEQRKDEHKTRKKKGDMHREEPYLHKGNWTETERQRPQSPADGHLFHTRAPPQSVQVHLQASMHEEAKNKQLGVQDLAKWTHGRNKKDHAWKLLGQSGANEDNGRQSQGWTTESQEYGVSKELRAAMAGMTHTKEYNIKSSETRQWGEMAIRQGIPMYVSGSMGGKRK